jgi:hypothetical protein
MHWLGMRQETGSASLREELAVRTPAGPGSGAPGRPGPAVEAALDVAAGDHPIGSQAGFPSFSRVIQALLFVALRSAQNAGSHRLFPTQFPEVATRDIGDVARSGRLSGARVLHHEGLRDDFRV